MKKKYVTRFETDLIRCAHQRPRGGKSWPPEVAERNRMQEIALYLILTLLKRRKSRKNQKIFTKATSKVIVDKNYSFTCFVLFTKWKDLTQQLQYPGSFVETLIYALY